jgi:hypothetical protein
MADEYELYHGMVLRQILVESNSTISLQVDDQSGRIDSFVIDGRTAIHIKHSKKRLPPWQFTFSRDNIEELIGLDRKYEHLFLCFVCEKDGVVVLSPDEFLRIAGPSTSETYFVRVDRSRNTMYSVNGSSGPLPRKLPRGVARILQSIERAEA